MKRLVFLLLFPLLTFAQTDEIIDSGQAKLHFRTFGTGKPLLIINGGPGMNSEGFAAMATEISKMGYQTLIYDQRGTGKSSVTANSKNISMDLMAEDLENLRRYLKIEKWSILGHSFGGILAAHYASLHPDHIEKIIFSSSGGVDLKFVSYLQQRIAVNLTQIQKDSLDYFQRKRDKGDLSASTLKSRAKYLAYAYVYDKTKAPVIANRLIQINFEINALVIQDLQRMHFNCSKKFGHFKQPILVMQGENDIITTETAKEIAKAFPNSKLVLMPHCGHYGWLDTPEVYYQSIENFLNG